MAFEIIEANELVLAFLRHVTHSVAGIDRAGIAASITRSLALVDRFAPQFAGHDFYKRYARVRESMLALH